MDSISNIPPCGQGRKRLVIIGGGFGGLELAKKINERYYQTVLIDKNTYYQFQPLMYQVATGGLEPSSIAYPLRKSFQKKKDFHFRMCTALRILPDRKVVETDIGDIAYDDVVIATGADTNYFGNTGLKDTTYALKSISESLLLRNRILYSFEEAVNCDNPQKLKEILTFVIVGGGATGVELAGALADMRNTVLPRDYPEIDFGKMEIHLVDGSPRLLAGMSEKASANADKILTERGVVIHHNVFVESYDKPVASMNNGVQLHSRNVFWVAGVKPNAIQGLAESAYDKGFLKINKYCEVEGYDNIFAIGDTARLETETRPKGHPQVAQVAMQMASRLARNLNARAMNPEADRKEFAYRDKGSMATIGRNAAVADLGKFAFSGIVAWWLWLLVHIMFIIGLKNKLFVLINWIWNYVRYDSSLRLLIRPKIQGIHQEQIGDGE